MALAERWAPRDTAERHWKDAVNLPDATLDELLEVAEGDCLAYLFGVTLPDPLPDPPTRWILASIMQAREIRAAGLRDGDVIGVEGFAIRSRPLTGSVKQMLRPRSNRFDVA